MADSYPSKKGNGEQKQTPDLGGKTEAVGSSLKNDGRTKQPEIHYPPTDRIDTHKTDAPNLQENPEDHNDHAALGRKNKNADPMQSRENNPGGTTTPIQGTGVTDLSAQKNNNSGQDSRQKAESAPGKMKDHNLDKKLSFVGDRKQKYENKSNEGTGSLKTNNKSGPCSIGKKTNNFAAGIDKDTISKAEGDVGPVIEIKPGPVVKKPSDSNITDEDGVRNFKNLLSQSEDEEEDIKDKSAGGPAGVTRTREPAATTQTVDVEDGLTGSQSSTSQTNETSNPSPAPRQKSKVTFSLPLHNLKVAVGKCINLRCISSRSDMAAIWMKDGTDLSDPSLVHCESKEASHTLHIEKARFEDAGEYSVHVGDGVSTCVVTIEETDIIDQSLQKKSPMTSPVPSPRQSLQETADTKDQNLEKNSATSAYSPVPSQRKSRKDQNVEGKGSRYALPKGEEKMSKMKTHKSESPKKSAMSSGNEITLRMRLEDVEKYEGEDVQLFCYVSGRDIEVEWWKDEKKVNLNERVRKESSGEQQTLNISTITQEDAGLYMVVVGGKSTSAFNLIVKASNDSDKEADGTDNTFQKESDELAFKIDCKVKYTHTGGQSVTRLCHIECDENEFVKLKYIFKDVGMLKTKKSEYLEAFSAEFSVDGECVVVNLGHYSSEPDIYQTATGLKVFLLKGTNNITFHFITLENENRNMMQEILMKNELWKNRAIVNVFEPSRNGMYLIFNSMFSGTVNDVVTKALSKLKTCEKYTGPWVLQYVLNEKTKSEIKQNWPLIDVTFVPIDVANVLEVCITGPADHQQKAWTFLNVNYIKQFSTVSLPCKNMSKLCKDITVLQQHLTFHLDDTVQCYVNEKAKSVWFLSKDDQAKADKAAHLFKSDLEKRSLVVERHASETIDAVKKVIEGRNDLITKMKTRRVSVQFSQAEVIIAGFEEDDVKEIGKEVTQIIEDNNKNKGSIVKQSSSAPGIEGDVSSERVSLSDCQFIVESSQLDLQEHFKVKIKQTEEGYLLIEGAKEDCDACKNEIENRKKHYFDTLVSVKINNSLTEFDQWSHSYEISKKVKIEKLKCSVCHGLKATELSKKMEHVSWIVPKGHHELVCARVDAVQYRGQICLKPATAGQENEKLNSDGETEVYYLPVVEEGKSKYYLMETMRVALACADDKECITVAVVKSLGRKTLKHILKEIFEWLESKAISQKLIVMCCVSEQLYEDCCNVCVEGVPKSVLKHCWEHSGSPIASGTVGTSHQLLVEVIQENLENVQADAIVTTVPENLDLKQGAISVALLSKAGPSLQSELHKKYRNGIKYGEIVSTVSFSMQNCSCIIHAALPPFKTNASYKVLDHIVTECVKEADRQKFSVLAFPAIGTGKLGYPKKGVAETIFGSLKKISEKWKQSLVLSTIKLAVNDPETLQEFQKQKKSWVPSTEHFEEKQILVRVSGQEKDVQEAVDKMKDRFKASIVQQKTDELAFTGQMKQQTKILEEPFNQEIERLDRPDGNARREMNEGKWKREKLKQWEDLQNYILISNIPNDQTEETLGKELGKLIKLDNWNLVYCKGRDTAVIICSSLQDAQKLLGSEQLKKFSAFKYDRNVLAGYRLVLGELFDVTKVDKNELDMLINQLKTRGISFQQEKPATIFTPTKYQLEYVKEKLEELGNEDTVVVSSIKINDTLWEIFQNRKSQICFQNDVVYYDEKTKMCTIQGTNVSTKYVYEFFRKLQDSEMHDIGIKAEHRSTAAEFCKEVGEDVCFLLDEQKRMVLACADYKEFTSKKHKFEIKAGIKKQTGRGGRQTGKAEASEQPMDEPVSSNSTANTKFDFQWSIHTKNVASFPLADNTVVYVYEADILKLGVDCIVNAANEDLKHGGGVAAVIQRAAGQKLKYESDEYVRNHGPLQVGTACTTTAGNLHYKCVVHTVGPAWGNYTPHTIDNVKQCEQDLYNAISDCFRCAEQNNIQSIAIPAVSSAIFGVPEDLCVHQYAGATIDFVKQRNQKSSPLREIHFIDRNGAIVKKIQEAFVDVLSNNSSYRSEAFVYELPRKQRAWNLPVGSGYPPATRSYRPRDEAEKLAVTMVLPQAHHTRYPSDDRYLLQLAGDNGRQKLFVEKCDIFQISSSAIVIAVDTFEHLGSIGYALFKNKKFVPRSHDYKSKLKTEITGKKEGDTFCVCDGYGSEYKYLLHAIVSRKTRDSSQVTALVFEIFRTLFINIREKKIESVSTGLFGIDTKSKEQVQAWCSGFLMAYTLHCKTIVMNGDESVLRVHIVSNEKTVMTEAETFFKEQTVNKKDSGQTFGEDHSKKKPDDKHLKNASEEYAMVDLVSDGDITDNCAICLDKPTEAQKLKCGHIFCKMCIDEQFKHKKACPTCGRVLGEITGNQPDGEMTIVKSKYQSCYGYEKCGQIQITYFFPSGYQKENHPHPGKWYKGIRRMAYLPDNKEGNDVLKMLKVAFDRKLVFTIGNSRTTGEEGVITWNDIHHKTDPRPHTQFGYPDQEYLTRVKDELSVKGVTLDDIE